MCVGVWGVRVCVFVQRDSLCLKVIIGDAPFPGLHFFLKINFVAVLSPVSPVLAKRQTSLLKLVLDVMDGKGWQEKNSIVI